MKNRIWFKAKDYGWGWYPSTWQGWTILLTWIFLVVSIFYIIDKNSLSISNTLIDMVIPVSLALILLIFICYGTGEKPEWRWGGKKI